MKKIGFRLFLCFMCLAIGIPVLAQSDDDLFGTSSFSEISTDDDLFSDGDFFGGDDMFGEAIFADESSTSSPSLSAFELIDTQTLKMGGSLSTSLKLETGWNNLFTEDALLESCWKNGFYDTLLTPSIDALIYFDARPSDNLRLYGKTEIDYPFVNSGYLVTELGDVNSVSVSVPSIKVKEMFTDFSFKDKAFFRFGKHAVKWGVGYFFSPADVINLGAIDPEEPTKEREGPVSLRTQVVFPETQNNLYLYMIAADSLKARDTTLAGKFEFVTGGSEIGIGAWYKYQRTPRLVATLTTTLFKKIGFYAELVGAYGTEEQWEEYSKESPTNVFTYGFDPVFQGTAGFTYTWNRPKITFSGQYFYNGFGASDPTKLSIIGPSGSPNDSEYAKKATYYNYVGKHYGALVVSKSELFTKKLSGSAFCLISFSDFSGQANLSFSWETFSNCSVSIGPFIYFGDADSEFMKFLMIPAPETNANAKMRTKAGITLSLSLGGGKF